MGIWHVRANLEEMNERGKNTMSEHLGIEIVEMGDNYLTAKMPVDSRTKQPMGIMHGGASCVLAETVGSIASNGCVDPEKYYCVGLDINTSHIRMAKSGFVYGTATPVNLGKKIHVWEIKILDSESRLISLTRLTLAVLDRR